MVMVKTPTGWKKVNSGESIGGVTNSTPSNSNGGSSSSGGSSNSGGFSSLDPNLNTNPAFPTSNGGSSSSGGSSNAFLDLINKGKEEAAAKLEVVAPNYSPSNNNNFNTISNIQNVVSMSNAENRINAIDKGAAAAAALGINKQSNLVSGLVDKSRDNAVNKLQSVGAPDSKFIADSGYKGDITPTETITAQTKVLRDRIANAAEKDINEYAKSLANNNKVSYNNKLAEEESNLKNAYSNIQKRINNGEDYDKLVKEFEEYQKKADERLKAAAENIDKESQLKLEGFAKEWSETKGVSMEKYAGLILRSTERLVRASPKQLYKKFKKSFMIGVPTGAAASIILPKLAKATGLTISKGVGAGITAGFAAVSVGKGYATAGYDVATGKLAKEEFLVEGGVRAVEGGVSFIGGFSGAVVGSVAVSTAANLLKTGTFRGIKPIEQKLARDAYNKNGLKSKVIKGEITESSIKKLSIGTQGKNNLMNEVKVGNVIRKTTYTPNTKGLSAAEIKALGKFGVKIDVYSVYDRAGNVLKTIEVAKITGRAPITKIYKGGTEIFSTGSGTIKGQTSSIIRTSVKYKGLGFKDRLTLLGQSKPRITDITGDKVSGTGAVANKAGFRLEVGAGKSESIFKFNVKSGVLDTSLNTASSRNSIFSRLTSQKVASISGGKNIKFLTTTNTFSDITGAGAVKPSQNSFFNFFKSAFASSGAKTTGTGLGGMGKKGSLGLFAPPKVVAPAPKLYPPVVTAPKLSPSIEMFSNNPLSSITKEAGFLALTAPAPSIATPVFLPLTAPAAIQQRKLLFNAPTLKIDDNILINAPAMTSIREFSMFAPAKSIMVSRHSQPLVSIQNQQPVQEVTQKIITAPAQTLQTNPTFKTPINPSFVGFGGFGLPLGRVKTGGGGIGKKEIGGLFGKTSYSASLGSVLTGYSKKGNAKSLSKQTFTGLGLRPIIEKPDKKKKKKKKGKKK